MEKKKKTGPDECCRAERQIGYEVRTLNQVIGRLVNSYQSKVDENCLLYTSPSPRDCS